VKQAIVELRIKRRCGSVSFLPNACSIAYFYLITASFLKPPKAFSFSLRCGVPNYHNPCQAPGTELKLLTLPSELCVTIYGHTFEDLVYEYFPLGSPAMVKPFFAGLTSKIGVLWGNSSLRHEAMPVFRRRPPLFANTNFRCRQFLHLFARPLLAYSIMLLTV